MNALQLLYAILTSILVYSLLDRAIQQPEHLLTVNGRASLTLGILDFRDQYCRIR
jgi:hypothetical protein